jgi:predicted nucleic acid-binding protein
MAKPISFLLDSNIWLERLLEQEKSEEVGQLLATVPAHQLGISDFSLHSIGVILFKLKRAELFNRFITDLFSEGNVMLYRLSVNEHVTLLDVSSRYNLDFDDSYQYQLTKRNDLEFVTFDSDFNRTDIMPLSPLTALELFRKL